MPLSFVSYDWVWVSSSSFLWYVDEEVISSFVALVSCFYKVDPCVSYSFDDSACVLLSDVCLSAPRVTGASHADKEVESNVTTKMMSP